DQRPPRAVACLSLLHCSWTNLTRGIRRGRRGDGRGIPERPKAHAQPHNSRVLPHSRILLHLLRSARLVGAPSWPYIGKVIQDRAQRLLVQVIAEMLPPVALHLARQQRRN